jgi:hypothetical protein
MVPLLERRAGKDAVRIEDEYVRNNKLVRTHTLSSEKGVSADTFVHYTWYTTTLLCGHPKTHGNGVFVSEYDPA